LIADSTGNEQIELRRLY